MAMMRMNGIEVLIRTAEEQKRTPQDVRGLWIRPRCRSKSSGRKGTRRDWKRKNPPRWLWFYREPTDVIMWTEPFSGRPMMVMTPLQVGYIKQQVPERQL